MFVLTPHAEAQSGLRRRGRRSAPAAAAETSFQSCYLRRLWTSFCPFTLFHYFIHSLQGEAPPSTVQWETPGAVHCCRELSVWHGLLTAHSFCFCQENITNLCRCYHVIFHLHNPVLLLGFHLLRSFETMCIHLVLPSCLFKNCGTNPYDSIKRKAKCVNMTFKNPSNMLLPLQTYTSHIIRPAYTYRSQSSISKQNCTHEPKHSNTQAASIPSDGNRRAGAHYFMWPLLFKLVLWSYENVCIF